MFLLFKNQNIQNRRVLSAAPSQILDLLQLSRTEREAKASFRQAMRDIAHWKKSGGDARRKGTGIHGRMKGILLRRRAEDAFMLYRIARDDRVRRFREYVERLPARGKFLRASS